MQIAQGKQEIKEALIRSLQAGKWRVVSAVESTKAAEAEVKD